MTKSHDIPIRIAKRMDSKKPRDHPNATRTAVTDVKTYPTVTVAKSVSIILRDETRMTAAAAAMAIPAEVSAKKRYKS
jgi:hypothetical protein